MAGQTLEQILERNGAKYFLALSIFFYILGTVIFNIYLRTLGSFEFELLQLRYMFVGIMFLVVTAIGPLLVWIFVQLGRSVFAKREKKRRQMMTPQQRRKQTALKNQRRHRIYRRLELIGIVLLIVWTPLYAKYVFPEIPPGFGGAKPIVGRLIGEAEEIAKINDMIAFETGVPVGKLPYELVEGRGDLAIGPNVKILDRNQQRIFLLLTKDLYLSSTSNFAKSLIESGAGEELQTKETVLFQNKPLIVSADKIESITLTLYEPPKITTTDDLKLAAKLIAENPERAQAVSDQISKDLPGVGEKLVAAVQKRVPQTSTPTEPLAPDPGNPPEPSTPDPVPSQPAEPMDIETVVEEAVEESVEAGFLDFRAQIFNHASILMMRERKQGSQNREQRNFLIQQITEGFKNDFPIAWAQLDVTKNYLITGQREEEFPRKIQRAFQGAESAETVIQRLNEETVTQIDIFPEVRDAALDILTPQQEINTEGNRKFVSQLLVDHFNQKAKQYREYWSAPLYLEKGVTDEAYFSHLTEALAATSWEEFRQKLIEFQTALEESQTPEPTCTDGIQNGDEEGVDCGGTCPDACEPVESTELEPTCTDEIQNGDETGVDCGGSCDPCPVPETCQDGIQNQDETGVDCGGVCDACAPAETCTDGIQNQDETDVDCGGVCEACPVEPTCTDGIQNGDEEGVDCGGSCPTACEVSSPEPTCADGIKNGDEEGIDCGGSCPDACEPV